MAVEVGQVLALKIKFNKNPGTVSKTIHPYLVVDVDADSNRIEIAQFDSLKGKEFKAARKSNKTVYHDNPNETVIDTDSFVQLDNTFTVENSPELERFRRQTDKLSKEKLDDILRAYKNYHSNNTVEDNKCVDMSVSEILKWN